MIDFKHQNKLMKDSQKWWNKLPFEIKFYKVIEANEVLEGDTADNHPDKLTRYQIKEIYLFHHKLKHYQS